jgi:hypothetical protein
MTIEVEIWENKNYAYREVTITEQDLENITKQKIMEWMDIGEEKFDSFKINNVNL